MGKEHIKLIDEQLESIKQLKNFLKEIQAALKKSKKTHT